MVDLEDALDLRIARCRLVVAGPVGGAERTPGRLRIATKYVRTTRRYFAEKGDQVQVIRLYGSMELAPLVGLADRIVDLVDTGKMWPKQTNIELHIEELALYGFAPGDRYRIGEAVERELTRLLAEQGTPHLLTLNVDLAQIDAGAFDMKPSAKSEVIGAQVAQAIYEGMPWPIP